MKMKKLLGILTVGVVIFSSCNNSPEDLYDPNAAVLLKTNEYAEAFVKQFGSINPNQDWGFASPFSRANFSVEKETHNWKNMGVKVPNDISEEEKVMVNEWFATHKNPTSISINFTNFWIQHVCALNSTIVTHYKNDGTISKQNENMNLDQLSVGDHNIVNDYNNSNGPKGFIQNSSTSEFGYFNNFDNKYSYDYTDKILYSVQCINGNYYVGFDVYGYKQESDGSYKVQGEETAGYYNDWIIKLTPVRYYRVIAEDLGSIGDFDFNDVVFDVKKLASQSDGEAELILQAAGGTLPLFIGCGSQEYEVHELFGVESDVMVNTGMGVEKSPVTFKLRGCQDINDVYIRVQNGDSDYVISAGKGEAPQKICVSTDFVWPDERVNLKVAYPNFIQYVQNELPDDCWY